MAANAASLGAATIRANSREDLHNALTKARQSQRTTVILVETDINQRVPGFESWWDVPIAETSQLPQVQAARAAYEDDRRRERYFFPDSGAHAKAAAPGKSARRK